MMIFDLHQVAGSFSRAAAEYDAAAVLQREIASRLFARLEYMQITPNRMLDVGCGTGFLSRLLQQRYRKSPIISLDVAEGMLQFAHKQRGWFSKQQFLCADAALLPLQDRCIDMLVSNLMLHWANDLQLVLQEMQRVLNPKGLLLFSTLGPATFNELRASWNSVDEQVHVHTFVDMHQVGDAMLQVGFADPVVDVETIVVTYTSVMQIMQDLKTIGAHNLSEQRSRGLTGKAKLASVIAYYENFRRADGLYPVTYEVVYGHAWGKIPQPNRNTVSLDQIKRRT